MYTYMYICIYCLGSLASIICSFQFDSFEAFGPFGALDSIETLIRLSGTRVGLRTPVRKTARPLMVRIDSNDSFKSTASIFIIQIRYGDGAGGWSVCVCVA